MEMRRELRYRLDIPALFSWQNAEQRRLYAEGVTRDISVLGAFIVSPTCPPLEAQVEVEVVLPSFAGMTSALRIKGEARVLRVEHRSGESGENGFAVVREASNQWSLALDREERKSELPERLGMTEKRIIH
jgi:hypothetical protein